MGFSSPSPRHRVYRQSYLTDISPQPACCIQTCSYRPKVLPLLPSVRVWLSIAWMPKNFPPNPNFLTFRSFPFSNSLLYEYPSFSSHTMSLLLPSFYTLCLWVLSSERRYIKHMLATHNLTCSPFSEVDCFISVLFYSALRASWVWDCWPAGLSVLPSLYRERAKESRGQGT